MQFEKARSLNAKWGDKPCNHPSLEKEYYLGAQTGDYVCSTCGETFTSRERDEHNNKSK